MERLTYRIGDKAYLKGGLDGKWEAMDRYDIIQNAVDKLATYEDKQEFNDISMENMKKIIAERDEYMADAITLIKLIDKLQQELLGEDYYIEDPVNNMQGSEIIVNDIIRKYESRWKKLKKWWRKKNDGN